MNVDTHFALAQVETQNLIIDWQGIYRYIHDFNNDYDNDNKYNQIYKDMKFKIQNVYLVKDPNMDSLLFVYEFEDLDKIVRYNCKI
jgi:hypothetical protein